MWRPKIGDAATSSNATDSPAASTGRRSTERTMAPQTRPSGSASPERRPTSGIRNELTRSPSAPSSAGSSVAEAITETMPTRIAPTARLRMIEFGTMNMPNIAITKVVPLKRTALFAVMADAEIASSFSRP
jgi:hypothetical protein